MKNFLLILILSCIPLSANSATLQALEENTRVYAESASSAPDQNEIWGNNFVLSSYPDNWDYSDVYRSWSDGTEVHSTFSGYTVRNAYISIVNSVILDNVSAFNLTHKVIAFFYSGNYATGNENNGSFSLFVHDTPGTWSGIPEYTNVALLVQTPIPAA